MSPRPEFQPTLQGEHVHLSPLQADDFEALHAAASDPEIWALHPFATRWQRDVFRGFFDECLGSLGGLCVRDAKTGNVIGHTRYSTLMCEPDEVEIGWTFLARAYWGGGTNGEMKRLMLDHIFDFTPRVIFRVGETNWRSRRAVEKIGGVLTDRIDHFDMAGEPARHVVYAIGRENWA